MSIQLTRRGLALGKPSTPPAGRTAWTVGMLTREAKSSAALVPVLVSIRRPENRRCDWRDRRDINKMDWNTMCREELRYSHWKDNPSRRELWDRWIRHSHHTYGRKKGRERHSARYSFGDAAERFLGTSEMERSAAGKCYRVYTIPKLFP